MPFKIDVEKQTVEEDFVIVVARPRPRKQEKSANDPESLRRTIRDGYKG